MSPLQRINDRLNATSLEVQAVIGGLVVAAISFVFSISNGIGWAVGTAAITGPIVGAAYYLGLRTANRNSG